MIIEQLLEKAREVLEGPMCLDKAILVAVLTHAGQTDKGGNSYIRHPLRVMEQLDNEDEMIVGITHDVVEDSEKPVVTLEHLTELGYTKSQVQDVDALTKREGETYPEAIDRVAKRVVARKVKIKDIRDNSQLWRLKNKKLGPKDMNRMQDYINALEVLGDLNNKSG